MIDGIGIHDAISIEIFCRCTECRRTRKSLAIPHRSTVADIRFRSIHPPSINSKLILRVKIFIHLSPEHLSGTSIISIIERTAEAEPVVNIILDGLMIHPALGIQFLIILYGIIELRPDRNHEATIHRMHAIEHSLRIRVTALLKFMATPRIEWPVVPVLYDIIYRNMQVAELLQIALDILTALIALTALPETKCPLRIHRSFTSKSAITRNNLIKIFASNEVVIHIRRHLAPDAQLLLLLLRTRSSYTKTTVGYITIRLPFYANRSLHTFLNSCFKFEGIRIPSSTPTLRDNQLAVDIDFHIASVVEDKLIEAIGRCLYVTLVNDLGTIQSKSLRQILNTSLICLITYFRSLRHSIFKIDTVFTTNDFLSVFIYVCTCQLPFLAILVIEFEGTIQLEIIVRITPSAV